MKNREQTCARPVELLAPAGGPEAGYAALHYGADAVYLGLPKFSARADAENFSFDQVSEITGYAHALTPRRRVYVALNTLVLQHELGDLIECLGLLSDIGVDALIVQDMGVVYIARRFFPGLRLHASTQLAIHSREGMEAVRELGFNRVTLARELTLAEITEASAVPDIETEVFVHGALCYAYSGLCLFSSQTLGRSGNRGKCAYLCRDQFSVTGMIPDLAELKPAKAGFLFSMKDLALPEALGALRRAGVTAFKIEGRKKSPLYVGATVNFYRKLLDGKLSPEEIQALSADIQTIFSRPWTPLFIQTRVNRQVIDSQFVGHRGTPVGQVEAVIRSRNGGTSLKFRTNRPLEVHDGLQLDLPGLPRPYGFAVGRFRIVSLPKNRFQSPASGALRKSDCRYCAPAGSVVEVTLPPQAPEIPRQTVISCASSQAIKRRYRVARPKPGQFRVRRQVNIRVDLHSHQLTVTASALRDDASALEETCTVSGEFPAAGDPARMHKTFQEVFGKLGDTQFRMGTLSVHNPQSRFVPVSQLNQLRRQLTDALDKKWQAVQRERWDAIKQEVSALKPSGEAPDIQPGGQGCGSAVGLPSHFRWSLKTDRVGLLDAFEDQDWLQMDEIIVELGLEQLPEFMDRLHRLAGRVNRERLRLALPMITRAWESAGLRAAIEKLIGAGWKKWQIANVSGWAWLRGFPAPVAGELNLSVDWPGYVTNSAAALQIMALGAESLTLSPEDGLENMKPLLAGLRERAVVIAYQDTPLFISESCVGASVKGACAGRQDRCVQVLNLISSFGDRVTAINRNCRTVVFNNRPFCLASRFRELAQAGAVRLRADFMARPYTPEQVRDIWQRLRAGENLPGTQLANIDRGLE